ncbi:hypothetical protein D3C86_539260 [compost metagenome]
MLFVQMLVRQIDETLQQAFPWLADGTQARTDHALCGDSGEFFHGLVPHQDLLILGQRADAHRQFLQGLAVVTTQGIEFGGQACEARVVILEAAFDEVDVFGHVVFAAGLVRQEGFHHVLGHARAHQAGEVGFDAVTQTAQGVRTAFVERQIKIAQGLLDFFLRSLGAQRFRQLCGEFLWRSGMQLTPLRATNVIHSAGFGSAGLFGTGVGEQRDQGEHQHVGSERSDGRHVPTGVVEHVNHVQQRDVETLQIADQRQQHGHYPDQNPRQQTGDKAATVGGRPVQHRQHPRQELQGCDKRDDAEVGQILLGAKHQVETETGHDDRDDQRAAGPLQPTVDVAFGRRLVERQNQVVQRHARQRQRGDDDQPAGRR